jgi:ABC-type glycerol-3-phosphate transport system substrate-binding protein
VKKLAFLAAVLLLLPALWLAAAGQQEKGPVTLTLWYPAGEITATSMPFRDNSQPWAAFEAANNCKVEVVAIDYETMKQKVLTAVAGGQAPDIGMVDGSWMGQFVKDGAFVEIPAADAKAWIAGVSPDTVAESDWGGGKMYGYPTWGMDAYALTWNTDMFRTAGYDPAKAPAYMDEFREYSKKLSVTEGGELKRVGYAIRHVGQPHGIVDKWDWLSVSSGVKYIDPPTTITGGKAVFTAPSTVTAFQKAHDMLYVDKSTSTDFPDPRECLLKGLAAMQISEVVSIQVRQPREAPNLKWAFAAPPAAERGGRPNVHTAAWQYSVFSSTKNKALALAAVKWFNSKENDFAQASKYESTPRWKENYDKEPFLSDPYVKQFKGLLPYGQPYPKHLALPGVMEALGAAIQKILHDEMKVADALAEAEKKANDAIKAVQ